MASEAPGDLLALPAQSCLRPFTVTQISFPLRRKAGTQTPRARGHSDRPSQAVIKVDSGDLPEKVFRQRKKVRGESLRVQVHERRKASEEPPQEGKWLFLLKKKKDRLGTPETKLANSPGSSGFSLEGCTPGRTHGREDGFHVFSLPCPQHWSKGLPQASHSAV